MEIPDYEDYQELESKIDRIASKLDKLIEVLPIHKTYTIGDSDKHFSSKQEAYDEVNRERQEYFRIIGPCSGSISDLDIQTHIQTPEEIKVIMESE